MPSSSGISQVAKITAVEVLQTELELAPISQKSCRSNAACRLLMRFHPGQRLSMHLQ